MTRRIGVLASGGGSNLGAILDYLDRLGDRRSGDVVLVASNRPGAGALARAERRGVAAALLAPGQPALEALLDAHRIDVVVLAGYLQLVPAAVTRRWRGRILNVHPSLLPAFGGPGMYGGRVHQAVLDAGARVTGATVHFVDELYDHGAIVAQWPVPVFAADDAATLAARVLRVEHALYPRVVDALCAGRLTLDAGNRVHGAFAPPARPVTFSLRPQQEEDFLEHEIDTMVVR